MGLLEGMLLGLDEIKWGTSSLFCGPPQSKLSINAGSCFYM